MAKPHFIIRNRFQKRTEFYQDILTDDILRDVCHKITGKYEYTITYEDDINIGRLAVLSYNRKTSYISFSETKIDARNSAFQSFPSALVAFHNDTSLKKSINFYFLPNIGNDKTRYFTFMYRLMKTAGTVFLNDAIHLGQSVVAFNSFEDLINSRDNNRSKNPGNKSTYITIDEDGNPVIYGKTYGANKYETTLICLAVRAIASSKIVLYEIKEQNLTILPQKARNVILKLGIEVVVSDASFENDQYDKYNSLRSPSFIYNLLDKLGVKKCQLCACKVPHIIQAAHVWPVASIKKTDMIPNDQKLAAAIDRDNGLWLCNNHHKLFDMNLLIVTEDGIIKYKSELKHMHGDYIHATTVASQIPSDVRTPKFLHYLQKRNGNIDQSTYEIIERG